MMSPFQSPVSPEKKLDILTRDSRYDLACACATSKDEHRRRSKDNQWIYPVTLPNGGTTFLFKTLLSNGCANDCAYCPLRADADRQRCSLTPEELARLFFFYYQARKVSGLFLSSGVAGSPDASMERLNRAAMILRRLRFKGYIHLKVIPGASDAAIRQSLSLATAVSLNIETAGESHFKMLSSSKNYLKDVLRPIELISRLTAKGAPHEGVKQTTQFVVGASDETDKEIIQYTWKLYRELSLGRVYFSAYQRGAGRPDLPGEKSSLSNSDLLMREHRLYQVDWLFRKYGFDINEIPFESDGTLSLTMDPKEKWASSHPEYFPVNVNTADRFQLLRVPGLGHITVDRILAFRSDGVKIMTFDHLSKFVKILKRTRAYLKF
ncbi:MAG: radical SAM protein [Candidatus Omnitrophota bacterium]